MRWLLNNLRTVPEKISFRNSTSDLRHMKTTKDFWRENLLSSYYIHKQTKQVHQTGGNGENANNRAHQFKVQTTKQRAEQQQPIQAQRPNQNPKYSQLIWE